MYSFHPAFSFIYFDHIFGFSNCRFMEAIKFNKQFILGITLVSAMGGLLFGYDWSFPLLNKALNASGTFWLYAFICLSGFLFILKKLPETKGKSLEYLEKQLSK